MPRCIEVIRREIRRCRIRVGHFTSELCPCCYRCQLHNKHDICPNTESYEGNLARRSIYDRKYCRYSFSSSSEDTDPSAEQRNQEYRERRARDIKRAIDAARWSSTSSSASSSASDYSSSADNHSDWSSNDDSGSSMDAFIEPVDTNHSSASYSASMSEDEYPDESSPESSSEDDMSLATESNEF